MITLNSHSHTMERLRYIRSKWPIFALMALYVYLAFHALSGSQGLMRWVDYESNITKAEAQLEAVTEKRKDLEIHAARLGAEQLDLDRLDVRSRDVLFVSYPKENTIWLDQTP